MIYHLLRKGEWEKAIKEDMYWPASLDKDGFIHCSTKQQIIKNGNNWFQEESEIILLEICSNDLESLVVNEDLNETGQMFPHIYGHLNLDAVKNVRELKKNDNGEFVFFESKERIY
ncbi:uncharacterized protein (DUF952 family) [Evansella vedderi]|uniref:Uncharacterized protein (DUF952 family) n=1 Tax=Evansella vedderi TaxID=38282 RepID=A0ABT9ZWP2_9BACI|nr:DUF952 domain-containing protein [Evansella vedderi]MDQ0255162.1 uncharacterized protein (DUF952 family) [Evansella vedderi]